MRLHDNPHPMRGYVCFFQQDREKLEALDRLFRSFVGGASFEEYHIPALIDGDVLERCGYFESFPHQLMAAGFVREEGQAEVAAQRGVRSENLEVEGQYLTPSACLHIYPMLEGAGDVASKVITTRARVFRHEKGTLLEKGRLRDFTVREIVVVGEKDYVRSVLQDVEEKAFAVAQRMTGRSSLRPASDHFYPSKENVIRGKIQRANSYKRELRIPIAERDTAVASFNYHDTHFSKAFHFDGQNRFVTGCVGFGLERWLLACAEHGFPGEAGHGK